MADFINAHHRMIHAVNNMSDDLWNPNRRWIDITDLPVNREDAVYMTGFLDGLLLQECSGNIPRRTGLCMGCCDDDDDENPAIIYSNEAVDVICSFLRRTTRLSALYVQGYLPSTQYRRILSALRDNTSVKDLKIEFLDAVEGGEWVADLLRHRNDFISLCFVDCSIRIPHILPFLREGPGVLENLHTNGANGDEGTRLLVEALLNNRNTYKNLKRLNLTTNGITSQGLRHLSRLGPDVLPSLEVLILNANGELLDDKEITQLFIRNVLLVEGATLKELGVRYCSQGVQGYRDIIRSLEKSSTVKILDITEHNEILQQAIREQLIRSLPRMTGLRQMQVSPSVIDLDDPRVIAAFRQNTSIFEIEAGYTDPITSYWVPVDLAEDPRLEPIIVRNDHLEKLDGMLGTAARTTSTTSTAPAPLRAIPATGSIPPPLGLWSSVVAKVGHGREGASPVFKILCNRLPTWIDTTSTSIDKKRRHTQELGSQNNDGKKHKQS